jgi:hypothetical protein
MLQCPGLKGVWSKYFLTGVLRLREVKITATVSQPAPAELGSNPAHMPLTRGAPEEEKRINDHLTP